MSDEFIRDQALVLFERAYRHQMRGELADAIILYQRSINLFPTAEAFTFLGWSYSMMGRFDEAIKQCHLAIETDPSYGNPYNDIGVYLIEQNKWEEAIPWFQRASSAPRYEMRQFPLMNLGRVYQHMGKYRIALRLYDQALAIDPFYRVAHGAKYQLIGELN